MGFSFLFIVSLFAFGKSSPRCILEIQRKPCPGMEAKALAPYNGKAKTEEVFQAEDENECLKQADYIGKIIREKSLAEKRIRIQFAGKYLDKEIVSKSSCRKNH